VKFYSDDRVDLYGGDSLAVLASLPTGGVDAVVSDPPYSSGGMVRGDRQQGTVSKYERLSEYTGTTTKAAPAGASTPGVRGPDPYEGGALTQDSRVSSSVVLDG